jgi:hypothetical protein
MHRLGVRVDLKHAERVREQLHQERDAANLELAQLAGR